MEKRKCKECGDWVNFETTDCPTCGYPLKISFNPSKLIIIAVLLCSALCLIGTVFWANKVIKWKDYKFINLQKTLIVSIDETIKSKVSSFKEDVVITPEFSKKIHKYEWHSDFSDGYAAVMNNNKWGYIDINGNEIITCRYDFAYPFIADVARVTIRNRDIFINTNAEILNNAVYPYSHKNQKAFDADYVLFQDKNGKYGYKDKNGEIIIKAKYNSIGKFNNGVARVSICTKNTNIFEEDGGLIFSGYVDLNGKDTFSSEDFSAIKSWNASHN